MPQMQFPGNVRSQKSLILTFRAASQVELGKAVLTPLPLLRHVLRSSLLTEVMRTTGYCQCGKQLTPVRGRHNSSWSPVLKKHPSRGTALIAHSTDYSATATDEGILQLPPKQQLQEEDLVNVFNYERDLQGKCASCLDTTHLSAHCIAHESRESVNWFTC